MRDHGNLLNETLIQEEIDRVETESNGTINFLAISGDVKYAYQDYMAQYKRNVDVMELKGGFKSLSYNGIPLVHDRFVPEKSMYLLDTSKIKLYQLCDWRFLESATGKILRQRENAPVYTATLVKYCDLICTAPNAMAKITNINRN